MSERRSRVNFIKTTILGGLFFLVPFVVVLIVVGKAFGVALRLAEPAANLLPVDAIAGIALANVLALMVILLTCFLAGFVATSARGKMLYRKIDEWLLNLVPRYAFVKSMAESLQAGGESVLKPVLVRFDDLAQIAFEVERGPGDLVTVYLPGSPDPWSGSVAQVTSDRVDEVAGDFTEAVKSLRQIGRGSNALIARAST